MTLRIRRTLTATPLARQYERTLLQRGPRKGVEVPWQRFDRNKYPEAALALAYDAQRMLALGEYSAVSLFARFVVGLARHGAPFDLVSAAARVPKGEIRHADLAFRFAAMCAAKDVSVEMTEAHRAPRWSNPMTLEDLDSFAIEVIAIGETLARVEPARTSSRRTSPWRPDFAAMPRYSIDRRARRGDPNAGAVRRWSRLHADSGNGAHRRCCRSARALEIQASAGCRETRSGISNEATDPRRPALAASANARRVSGVAGRARLSLRHHGPRGTGIPMIDLDRLLVPLTREGGAYRTQYEGIMTTDHARAILSLAVRMAYASGEATHEEIAFLESLSEWLAVRTERGAIALALDTGIENRDEEDFLRQHVAALASQPMRELAFKAAHVTRLCDFETDPMEEACEAELIEALDLAAVADDLRDEVNSALMGGEPEAI